MSRRRILLLSLTAILATLLLLPVLLAKSLPTGTPGPEADALAHRLMVATNFEAWQATSAVAFTFRGKHQYLWDRERGYVRVRFDQAVVWLDLGTRRGLAEKDGKKLEGKKLDEALEKAWTYFCNDTFWLNPLAKLFDDGTLRFRVETPEEYAGKEALLLTYTSGGVTPGDSYLWIVGEGDLPTHWRMWTSILPIKGLEASWEGWAELQTGAKVATRHKMGPATLELTDVRGAGRLDELEPGPDPFAALARLLTP